MSVPEGWHINQLEELALVERGKFSVRPRNDSRYFGGNIPFVQTGDIGAANTYLTCYSQTLNEDGLKVSKLFPKNSILITIAANIGDTAITTFDVACPDSVVAIQPFKDKADYFWLKMVLETCKDDLDSKSTQKKKKNINLQVLKPLLIRTPPLPEQKKIARILSTWDRAIEVAEKLLNNSRQQKKALMQQLLTGKKRLPGFNGKWKKVNIGNVVHIASGKSKSKFINENGERYIIDMGSISREGKLIPSKKTDLDEDYLLHEQLVMPKDDIGGGNIIGRVGFIDQDRKYVLGDHVYALYVHGCDSLFLCYLINHDTVNKSLRRKANGTAQLGLGKKDVEKQPVYIPNTKEEQQKIASVLSAANKEIEILEQKLGCLRQEKKALMQQLLTGKRRVKVDGSEAPEKEAARA